MNDIQDKCTKIDDAYSKKEQNIRDHYAKLKSDLDSPPEEENKSQNS